MPKDGGEIAPGERRESERHAIEARVRFRMVVPSMPEYASPFRSAEVCDVSVAGMSLLADCLSDHGLHVMIPYPGTMEQCLLEIELSSEPEPLTVQGRAKWFKATWERNPFAFRIGVQFTALTADGRAALQKWIGSVR